MTRRAAALLTTLLAVLLAAPWLAPAVASAARADLIDIEDEVMCVTCKIPLNIAEGPQPNRERELIRRLIEQGQTKEQIKAALVVEYGPQVLALPDDGGFGVTAYAIPLALLALLGGGLALLLPRWRRRAAAPAAAGGPGEHGELSDADATRLDADLARYDA